MCARPILPSGCCLSLCDNAWAYVKINGRDIWNARKARRAVRGRDPNVTEQAGTRPVVRLVLSGPVTSPRAATRQNPLHGPRPCASGVSPHTESSVYAFSPLFVQPGDFWPPHPTFWAFFAYSRDPQYCGPDVLGLFCWLRRTAAPNAQLFSAPRGAQHAEYQRLIKSNLRQTAQITLCK